MKIAGKANGKPNKAKTVPSRKLLHDKALLKAACGRQLFGEGDEPLDRQRFDISR
ncbi:MAG: hypothetical protein WAU60_17810 [Candidatus Competibacter denitrificans]|uniref:hypothetical protein n=1 Tax=Candidatus Competibacter denitrificans TaxID=1400862 RepID=UPI00149462EB|nr:hypothetical protein [Candidatus Competibacter denitrificans]HRC69050.1 hypothetical protein [Candidatus Competibacter denitrificans]